MNDFQENEFTQYQSSDYKKFEEHKIKLDKNGILPKYKIDLNKAKKIFIDFEVFKKDWLLVAIDGDKYNSGRYKPLIIVNDRDALLDFYLDNFKSNLLLGYNIKGYDLHVLRCILEDRKSLIGLNNLIISGGNGYMYDKNQNIKWPIDVYDVIDKFHSLKQLEAFMGNSIIESSVDFTIDRKLTQEEIEESIKYCTNDVEQCIEVFNRKINDFNATKDLIETFELPTSFISKTHAQLSATILGCNDFIAKTRKKCVDTQSSQVCYELNPPRRYTWDEWNVEIAPTIKIEKYTEVLDFFKNRLNFNYKSELEIDVAGIPHKFGFGGIHGCPKEPLSLTGNIWHVDVNSYYPSLMIQYGLLTRNVPDGKDRVHVAEKPLPETNKYVQIYNKRLQLKREGKKKEQAPYKIVLNSTYGITKDATSAAYDPKQANNICINGQLMLLDLLEKLEGYCQIIQSNTDGIIIKIPDGKTEDESKANEEKVRSICQEWENRTHMGLGLDRIKRIFQKDVNNYVFETIDGDYDRKGAYLKQLNDLDYDLPIVNKAMFEYLMHDVPVEDTINKTEDLKEFQKIVKVSSKYEAASHNGELLNFKTYRVFASKQITDGALYKTKTINFKKSTRVLDSASLISRNQKSFTKEDKFGNTPDHCCIMNGNINGLKVKDFNWLDKQYYIDEAKHRLNQFGAIAKVKRFKLF